MVKHNRKNLLFTALLSLSAVAVCQIAQPLGASAEAKKKFANIKAVQATTDIPPETVIPKSAVTEKSVLEFYLPIDTMDKSASVVGRMSKVAIRKGEPIALHMLCVTPAKVKPTLVNLVPELKHRTAYLTQQVHPNTKVPLVYVAYDVKGGETIQGNHLMLHQLPARKVPHDSCETTMVAAGMKARYDLRKGQILSLYDLSL
jgi:flagella basal body P-ring formation protein FlgA